MTTSASPQRDPPPSRLRSVGRLLLAIIVLPIVLGVLVVLAIATTPWGNEIARRLLVSQANGRLTGELSVGALNGNLFQNATLTDVRVVDSVRQPVFTARRVAVRYALWPALRGRIVIRSLLLDTALVVLDKRPGRKRWNFQALFRPTTTVKDTSRHAPTPELSNFTIRHGRMLYRRPWSPDSTLSSAARDSVIASVLRPTTRRRTERVPGGFQRVLDYHDMDARLPSIRLPHAGQPFSVEIAPLSMLAEPYRPPAINVRSLSGTLYVAKDSLWWRGAHMIMPASRVSGDGTIGFHRLGFWLDLTGTPVALGDLRWLDPSLPADGGGTVRYAMHVKSDSVTYTVTDADIHYHSASIAGKVTVARISKPGRKPEMLVRDVDLTVAKLTTSIIHEFAPSLPIRRRGTVDGHLAVTGPPRALRVNADLRFDDVVAGLSHVTARGGLGIEHGVRARQLVLGLSPLRLAMLGGTGVRLPLGGVVSGRATVSGAPREGFSVSGDLTHVDRGALSRVMGSGTYQVVGKRILADATLKPLSLVTAGRFAPSLRLRGAVTGHVRAEGNVRDLTLSGSLRSTAGGGAIDARGTASIHGSRSRYDIAAVLDALNANAFSRRAPRTLLTGSVSARGAGFAPATANAVISADLAHSSYDTFVVERVRARLATAGGLLRIDTLDVLASGVRAEAAGTFGLTSARSGTLRFAAAVDSIQSLRPWMGATDTILVDATAARQRAHFVAARADSARRADAVRIERIALGLPEGVSLAVDSLPPLRRDSLAGRLAASGMLRGNVRELGIDAALRGSGLVVRGYAARQLSGMVATENLRGAASPLTFSLDADTVEASGYAFEHIGAAGTYRQQQRQLTADVRVRQDSLVSYAAAGSYFQPSPGKHVIRLDSLRATFDTLVWRLAHASQVELDHGGVSVDSFDFRSSARGRLFANGVLPRTDPIHFDVVAENVRVATVLRAMQRDAIADGAIAARAHVEGWRGAPVMTGTATLRHAKFQDTRAPDVDVSFDYANRTLDLHAVANDSTGRRVLAGKAVIPYDLAFSGPSGSRKVAGPLVADVVLDSFDIAALPFKSSSFDELRGKVGAEVRLRGSWRDPILTGRAGLRQGGFLFTATGMRVADAVADLRLTGDTLKLDSLVARIGGPVRASGSVDLSHWSHPRVMSFTAAGTNLRLMDQNRGLVDADAALVASGPLDALRVTGRGKMLGGYLALKQFRKDLLRVKSPGDLSFLVIFDTSAPPNDATRRRLARAQPKRIAIIADLSLVIDYGNYYRNRPDANVEYYTGDGEEVRVHIDQRTSDQFAVGFVRIGGGEAFYRTQPFRPSRGTLTFGPHTNALGIIQQVGVRNVWEYGRGWFPLQLFTGGTSKAQSIGLESGTIFPIKGHELNSYLTMGRTATSLTQKSGSSLSGSESWSGQLSGETGALAHRQQGAVALGVALHDLGTGATKEFGLDAFSVSAVDVPTELVFGKMGGVRGALIEGGRYLTTDRYVAGELTMTTSIPGFRISQKFGTTYRLDAGVEPRFLFRAPDELGITHPTIRTGVFGLFLTRLWDF